MLRSSRGVRYEFQITGTCIPQQWEASVNGRAVLYARCRGGEFSAHYYPNADINNTYNPTRHLLMEVYLIPVGGERTPGTELEAAEEVAGMTDDYLELPDHRTKMAYLRRAIEACDQWRFNEAAGVANVSPRSHREEKIARINAQIAADWAEANAQGLMVH